MTTLRPWTQVALPHDDVRDSAAVKAEYAVNLGRVDRDDPALSRHYRDPRAFFEATFLTADLKRLLGDVLAALTGKKTDRVLQLRTPFGGGKTHSLVALLHLVRSRAALAGLPDLAGLPNPSPARVASLPCADLTPANPRAIAGGATIRTLWGELAYRLGGPEAFARVREIDERMTAPGGDLLASLVRAPGTSTLILADEVLVYVEKAMTVPAGDSTLGRQTLAFLQALTETVAGDPSAAFVYSLQASVAEAIGDEGLLQALDKLVGRVDARRVPVQDREVREIIRRRLFKEIGTEADRHAVADGYARIFRDHALARAETDGDRARVEDDTRQFRDEILASYPFHPALIRLMYERWGSLPSYQRTRGALQFLGTVVHVLFRDGHQGALIAPSDIPLRDPDVRSEFFRQVGEREKWDSVLDADVAGANPRAKQVDRRIGESSPVLAQARIGTCAATTVTMYSFGARNDEMRGVLQGEVVTACLRPGVDAPVIQAALSDLRETLLYLHATGGRLRMDTIPSLTKLIEESLGTVTTDEVLKRIETTLADLFRGSATAIVWPLDPGRVPDGRREFLLAYMPLDWAEMPASEVEPRAREIVKSRSAGERGGVRTFRNGLGVVLPQKAYADQARSLSRRALALEALRRKAKAGHVQVSAEQVDELEEKARTAARDLEGACRGIYGRVLLPVVGKNGDPIGLRTVEIGSLAAAGGELHARILELIKKQVFTEITSERFVELAGLTGRDAKAHVPLGTVLDAFFSFLDRPKVRSDAVLLAALADAVATRRIGYVPAARAEGELFTLADGVRVRFGTAHSPSEFAADEGAFLVAPDLASKLAAAGPAAAQPGATGGQSPATSTGGTSTTAHEVREGPPVVIIAKGTTPTRFRLTATANDKMAWFRLAKAINELAGMADRCAIEVNVDAHRAAGLDPVDVRNRVTELLIEAGIRHDGVATKE